MFYAVSRPYCLSWFLTIFKQTLENEMPILRRGKRLAIAQGKGLQRWDGNRQHPRWHSTKATWATVVCVSVVAFVTVAFHLRFRHKILVDDFLQSLSLYIIYYLHLGKQWCTVCCFGYGHHNLGLIRTTTSFAVMGRSANIAVIQLYNAGKQVFFVSLTHSGTNSIQ